LNKILIKEDYNWNFYYVEFRDNYILKWDENAKLNTIDEINVLIDTYYIEDFKKELEKMKEKGKDYSWLFKVYSSKEFFSKFKFYFWWKDWKYQQIYLNFNWWIQYYNSNYYIWTQLTNILKNNPLIKQNYLIFYIPIKYNQEIDNILKFLWKNYNYRYNYFKNASRWEFWLEIKFEDENILWDKIIDLWIKNKLNNIFSKFNFYYKSTYIILTEKQPFYVIFYVIVSWILGFYLWYLILKLADKKLKEVTKFEKEKIVN